MKNTESIRLIVDRDSVCMADDVFSHRRQFEFNENIKILELIKQVEEDREFKAYGGGIWAGHYDNFKCIRDNFGKYKISESVSAKNFFDGIENYIKFERNSKRCE